MFFFATTFSFRLMHDTPASVCPNSMLTESLITQDFTFLDFLDPVFHLCAGEPGQLEASLRQLDQALDAGRYHLQQREATANSSSPDIDSTYMGYVSVVHLRINLYAFIFSQNVTIIKTFSSLNAFIRFLSRIQMQNKIHFQKPTV